MESDSLSQSQIKGGAIKGVTILLYAFGIFQQKQVHAAYRKEDF